MIRQTLLSAALQDYPNKRVVLLLDDPPAPKTRQDLAALWAARSLPFELQTLLASAYHHVTEAKSAFHSRQSGNVRALKEECVCLADCFRWTAEWFETQAKLAPIESHTDVWFIEHILMQPGQPDVHRRQDGLLGESTCRTSPAMSSVRTSRPPTRARCAFRRGIRCLRAETVLQSLS